MSGRPDKAVIAARLRLRQAIDRACIARGEAQWMQGYRTGRFAVLNKKDDNDDDLYRKERARFEVCGRAERQAEREMATYARAIRQSSRRRS